MTISVKTCLIMLLVLLLNPLGLNAYANPSYTVSGNATHVSMRVNASFSNSVLAELFLVNNMSSTVFKPESLRIGMNGSVLLVNYDARVYNGFPLNAASMGEDGGVLNDWVKYLQLLILFAAGLTLLASDTISTRKSEKELLESMDKGGAPPKGSRLSEEALLLLASKNPDAYRRALDMVLKGELKVERRRRGGFKSILQKMKRLINNEKANPVTA